MVELVLWFDLRLIESPPLCRGIWGSLTSAVGSLRDALVLRRFAEKRFGDALRDDRVLAVCG